jgi:hypothetical protein
MNTLEDLFRLIGIKGKDLSISSYLRSAEFFMSVSLKCQAHYPAGSYDCDSALSLEFFPGACGFAIRQSSSLAKDLVHIGNQFDTQQVRPENIGRPSMTLD